MTTQKRKKDHIRICLEENVEMGKTTGLEDLEFVHDALTNVNFKKISTKRKFLNKTLSFPLIIEGMSGGTKEGMEINKTLAKSAQKFNVALGVGSQRAMIEDENLWETYYVRDVAPDILLIGNIGLIQLADYGAKSVENACKRIEADGLAIHLNSLQEVVQPEGDVDFSTAQKGLSEAKKLKIPYLFKETGAGISGACAKELEKYKPSAIDVGAAGGTSWSAVEYFRNNERICREMRDWGIPLVSSLMDVVSNVDCPVIASGGIRGGVDGAKTIALGAYMFGAALPFFKKAAKGGHELNREIEAWILQFKRAMFLVGAQNLPELSGKKIIITGKTLERLREI